MDKIKFLMSDTGAEITAACREALEQKGVEVTVVEKDGLKVLQKMLAVRPQVVLLDAFMPGLDALAVKQKYNAAGERHTSFFVTGAFQSEEMVQELLDEGFAYYFVKPFDETVLANRVLKVAAGQPSFCRLFTLSFCLTDFCASSIIENTDLSSTKEVFFSLNILFDKY